MIHLALSRSRITFRSAQVQRCGIVLLACGSWLAGAAPGWSGQVLVKTGASTALAQSADQIRSYASAVLDIEPLRQQAYRKVKGMMKGNVPNDVCRHSELPGDVRSICSNFFDESANRIRQNNLSIGEFNDITQKSQTDSGLMNKIQKELIRQQH
jgi:Domain of unknown function (DUF4168)